MDYSQYYERCKQAYSSENGLPRDTSQEALFYSDPVRQFNLRSVDYDKSIEEMSVLVKQDFDSNNDCDSDNVMVKHSNMWKYDSQIKKICESLVPKLEKEMFYCNLYVDKIYIYRTMPMLNRQSSYVWHYDNNPNEVVKTVIYLSDVNGDEDSPYQYFTNKEGKGMLGQSTRTGPNNWSPAPNNSRVDHLVENLLSNKSGYGSRKIYGLKGTSCTFNNNAVHRANPIISSYRDVINIRVKPTLEPAPTYADPKWTTGFEHSGVVNQNPEYAWTKLV